MSTAESYIQLPTDGQGKKHRTITETVSGSEVHHPVMMLADPSGTAVAVTSGITVNIGNNINVSATANTTTRITDGTEFLSIDSSNRAQVAGTLTPADNEAVTDAVNVIANLRAYNGATWSRLFLALTAADGVATNTSALITRNHIYGFNGTTWDRLRSDTTNGLDVDVTRFPSVSLDTTNNSVRTITHLHEEIHDGNAFSYADYASISTGGTATRDILIVTPNTTKWAHFRYVVQASQEVNVVLYEAATTSNDGTGITEVNRNRNSATTATVAVTHTPTVTGTGTQIEISHIGASRVTGGFDSAHEWLLKQNTKYLIRITAEAATDTDVTTHLFWYEYTNL